MAAALAGARPEVGEEAAEEEEAGEAPPGAAPDPPRRSARMLAASRWGAAAEAPLGLGPEGAAGGGGGGPGMPGEAGSRRAARTSRLAEGPAPSGLARPRCTTAPEEMAMRTSAAK